MGLTRAITITIYKDSQEAADEGCVYSESNFKSVVLKQVVVVKKGTEAGNSTVDLILEDEEGNKYVTLVTSRILKSIPHFCD